MAPNRWTEMDELAYLQSLCRALRRTAVREYLTEARTAVAAQFDQALHSLQAAIARAPDQAKPDLRKKLAELKKARAEAIENIDDQLAAVS